MVETWRLVTSFILIIIAFDLVLGLPFVYGKQGLSGQVLSANTEFSDDAYLGLFLEKTLYTCTSLEDENVMQGYENLPKCSSDQTFNVYFFVAAIIPIIAIILTFAILNPKVWVGLLREGL